jgi:hemolysin III
MARVTDWEAPYTGGEETANAVSHIVGSHLGAAMTAILCYAAYMSGVDVAWKIVSGCIFGFSTIFLYAISGAYHAVSYKPAKDVLNVMDHMAIYVLIAGSYTPFCLQTLRGTGYAPLGWTIFGIEWFLTVVGILFKVWTTGKFRFASTAAYVLMGWVAVFAFGPIARGLGALGVMWLVIGGVLYTLGTVFYLWKSMPYHHFIWHLFVLAGTICQFFSILWYVME